jgi:hypothetical protein
VASQMATSENFDQMSPGKKVARASWEWTRDLLVCVYIFFSSQRWATTVTLNYFFVKNLKNEKMTAKHRSQVTLQNNVPEIAKANLSVTKRPGLGRALQVQEQSVFLRTWLEEVPMYT